MPKEIERKYLLYEGGVDYTNPRFERKITGIQILKKRIKKGGSDIRQGYLPVSKGLFIADSINAYVNFTPLEARLRHEKNRRGHSKFTLTLKGDQHFYKKEERDEKEIIISENQFNKYWSETKGNRLSKKRYEMKYGGFTLEIDLYPNLDLIVAEIEVRKIRELRFIQPPGLDITKEDKYKNINLAR